MKLDLSKYNDAISLSNKLLRLLWGHSLLGLISLHL